MEKPKKNPKRVAAGKLNGQIKSDARARASRRNGEAGGRPKGIPTDPEIARKGAAARAAKLSPERRSEIARNAVAAREAKRKKGKNA